MTIFYEAILSRADVETWDSIPLDVTDEIRIVKLQIREKLISQKRFKEHNVSESAQQIFDFGGSIETTLYSGEGNQKKTVLARHDYGQKSLRGLFITLKDLLYVQLEYLKFQGERSDMVEKNLQSLIHSIDALPDKFEHESCGQ